MNESVEDIWVKDRAEDIWVNERVERCQQAMVEDVELERNQKEKEYIEKAKSNSEMKKRQGEEKVMTNITADLIVGSLKKIVFDKKR